jgi:phage baseplate assembly protein W
MPVKIIYSDINKRAGDQTNEVVTNAASLNQNIIAIFETPIGSKWFREDIGTNIEQLLFDPIDDITADSIREEMVIALENNKEDRLVFTAVTVLPDPVNSQFYVKIVYTAPELELYNYGFSFNLAKGIQ